MLQRQTNPSIRIGIDLMGSENSPEALLEEIKSIPLSQTVELVLVGSSEFQALAHPFRYYVASEVIEMQDPPLTAVRKKKDSSLCVGLRLLQTKQIDAFISAGNTGALVSASKMILGNLPGILRPALLSLLPTKKKPIAVLDLGAGIQTKAAHLLQFAAMGVAYQKIRGIQHPIVGLLNIGSEETKGTADLRSAYQKLQQSKSPDFQFAGNIEGTAAFEGNVDVLVTDGFTGNIFLKTAEGIASLILDRLYTHLPKKDLESIQPHLLDLHRQLHYAEYPGALLAGVNGVVIKCHGYSTPQGFTNAIQGAIFIVEKHFLQSLQRKSHRT